MVWILRNFSYIYLSRMYCNAEKSRGQVHWIFKYNTIQLSNCSFLLSSLTLCIISFQTIGVLLSLSLSFHSSSTSWPLSKVLGVVYSRVDPFFVNSNRGVCSEKKSCWERLSLEVFMMSLSYRPAELQWVHSSLLFLLWALPSWDLSPSKMPSKRLESRDLLLKKVTSETSVKVRKEEKMSFHR